MDDIQSLEDAIEFAKAWAALGQAIQEQVETVLLGEDDSDVNSNAIRLAMDYDRLGQFEDIRGSLHIWLTSQES